MAERQKLNAGAQLQNFPYPTMSKPLPYSSALMAIEVVSTNSTIQHRDGLDLFPCQRCVKFEPQHSWHADRRGPYHYFCTFRICSDPTYSFAAQALKMLGKTHFSRLNPYNFGTLWVNPTKFKTSISHGTAHKRWKFGKYRALDTPLQSVYIYKFLFLSDSFCSKIGNLTWQVF